MKERILGGSALIFMAIERYIAYLEHKLEVKASAASYNALLEAFVESTLQ